MRKNLIFTFFFCVVSSIKLSDSTPTNVVRDTRLKKPKQRFLDQTKSLRQNIPPQLSTNLIASQTARQPPLPNAYERFNKLKAQKQSIDSVNIIKAMNEFQNREKSSNLNLNVVNAAFNPFSAFNMYTYDKLRRPSGISKV